MQSQNCINCVPGRMALMAEVTDWSEQGARVLTELYEAVGAPAYVRIKEQGERRGDKLSESTVHNLLNGKGKPRQRTVDAFIKACFGLAMPSTRKKLVGIGRDEHYWLQRYDEASERACRAVAVPEQGRIGVLP